MRTNSFAGSNSRSRQPRARRVFNSDNKAQTGRDFSSRSSFRGDRNPSSAPRRSGRFGGGDRFSRGSNNRGSNTRGGRGGGGRSRQSFDVSRYINLNPTKPVTTAPYQAINSFADFGLNKNLLAAIEQAGLITPSAIQDQAIPLALAGNDVIGLAETGTGKTAAFLIPTIEKTLKNNSLLTLILAPTRELAIQVEQELRKLTPKMGIYSTVCVGGTSIMPQIRNLRRKNQFIIGTPGRVIDLIDRGNIRPERITNVILDEADRMLDMGFIHDIKKILKNIPAERETLFFSATMSKDVEGLVYEFLNNPTTVSVKKADITCSISQDVVRCEPMTKLDTLINLLKDEHFSRVIVFGAMKHSVEKLSHDLIRAGITADAIHGNKSHGQRQQALQRFKSGQVKVLVATDVAARGIHVDNVSHVINYDLPNTYEDYIHRIGRTGRGDKHGEALTFVPAR